MDKDDGGIIALIGETDMGRIKSFSQAIFFTRKEARRCKKLNQLSDVSIVKVEIKR